MTHEKGVLREPLSTNPEERSITFHAGQIHCNRHDEFETGCPECILDLGHATYDWRMANKVVG